MNLTFTSFLKIILGGLFGAPIFWLISFLLPKGMLSNYEQMLTLQQIGLLFGGLLGSAVTIVVLLVQDSHRPEIGRPLSFRMINGIGSMLIGKSESQDDGSYLTTERFCMLWLQLFPVCTYRIIDIGGRTLIPLVLSSRQFDVIGKQPVRFKDVVKGYCATIAAGGFFALVVWRIAILDQ